MRRVALATVLLVLLPVGAARAHAGHGPQVVSISEFSFAPAAVKVVAGDYVFWDWQGPDTNHSVTADAGQRFTFDSDPDRAPSHKVGDGLSVHFTEPGTWTYHCKVHDFMTASVEVLDAGPAPVVTAPRLRDVAISRSGRRLRVSFRVSQAASMRATIRRSSGGRTLREYDFAGPPGRNRRTLSLGRLRAGRYRFALVAVDTSTGKATKPVVRSFTMS